MISEKNSVNVSSEDLDLIYDSAVNQLGRTPTTEEFTSMCKGDFGNRFFNELRKPKKLQIVSSMSGGGSSGLMSVALTKSNPDTVCVFANTGQEREETLEFVRDLTIEYGLDVVWIEAVVSQEKGVGTTYKIVDFETAHRGDEIFEAVIKAYGIPNQAYPHCTRELKNEPIKKYLQDTYGKEGYKIAIGIRADEHSRFPKIGSKNPYRTFYPMIEHGVDKFDKHSFFEDSKVRLGIESIDGNCKTCWKLSEKKLAIRYHADPESFDFNRKMEKNHGLAGHNVDGTKRVFFRGNKSTKALIESFPDYNYDLLRKRLVDEDHRNLGAAGCAQSCLPFLDGTNTSGKAKTIDEVIQVHKDLDPNYEFKHGMFDFTLSESAD